MSSPTVNPGDYTTVHAKARCFYSTYERKQELQHQTHYCPGCGHGILSKMLARAIDALGIQDRTILISPVGCSVFGYYYFDVGNIQAAHGRAPAVATAVKRSRPDSITISYQGDGDLSAIGSAEILHAANRGENITAIFVNNAIYSMTGGQAAPTTLLGQKSTTTPSGRSALTEGYPLRISELLATLDAPVYIARVGLGDNKQIAQADRAIRRAVENQVRGLGFSLVEVLSPCPTIWKMSPVDAQRWVRDVMEKTYPLAVLRDRTAATSPNPAEPRPAASPAASLATVPNLLDIHPNEVSIASRAPSTVSRVPTTISRAPSTTPRLPSTTPGTPSTTLGVPSTTLGAPSFRPLLPKGWETTEADQPGAPAPTPKQRENTPPNPPPSSEATDLHIRIAGFGGQGVLLLGEVLAEAGLDAGLEVSWLPSYGPEMRSGTSNCHVRLSSRPIDSPLVTAPNLLVAMNEPSLHKFLASVQPGGWVLYNGETLPPGCSRHDLHVLAAPFTQLADELGEPRTANMIMLGALLEVTRALPDASIDAALRKLVRHARWLDLDRFALARGRALLDLTQGGFLPCPQFPAPTPA